MRFWNVYRIAATYLGFFALGLCSTSIGPCLVHMETLLGVDTKTMGLTFFASSIGFLVGSILCGLMFDRFHYEVQLAATILMIGIATATLPWMPSIVPFMVMHAMQSVSMGYFEPGGDSYTILQCPSEQVRKPVLTGLHAVWSLGAAVAPFLIKPFLVDLPDTEEDMTTTATVHDNYSTEYSWESLGLWGAKELVTSMPDDQTTATGSLTAQPNLSTPNPDYGTPEGVERVRFAFMLTSSCTVIPFVMFLILLCSRKGVGNLAHFTPNKTTKPATNGSSKQPKQDDSTKMTNFQQLVLGVLFIIYVVHIWYMAAPAIYLSAFTIKQLGWDPQDGATVMVVFWGAHGLSRFVGIPVSAFLSPAVIVLANIVISAIGYTMMLFVHEAPASLMWISAGLVGMGLGTTFSMMMLWASQHMRVTGRVAAVLFCGGSLGGLMVGPVMGYLSQEYSPMTLVYGCLISVLLHFILFVVILVIAKLHKDDPEDLSMTYVDSEGNSVELKLMVQDGEH